MLISWPLIYGQCYAEMSARPTPIREIKEVYLSLRLLLASLLLHLPLSSVAAWEDYKEKSLQATIDEISASAEFAYTPGLPQLVLVTYTGEKRAVPENRMSIVRNWVELIGQPTEVGDLFFTEMKFLEDGKHHWLPTQKPLIAFFEKEISPGEQVWLYAVWVGATESEWVFVVNEFEQFKPK